MGSLDVRTSNALPAAEMQVNQSDRGKMCDSDVWVLSLVTVTVLVAVMVGCEIPGAVFVTVGIDEAVVEVSVLAIV